MNNDSEPSYTSSQLYWNKYCMTCCILIKPRPPKIRHVDLQSQDLS